MTKTDFTRASRGTRALLALALLALPAAAQAYNESFDIPSGTGPTSYTSAAGGYGGSSAAAGWFVYHNSDSTTTTELLPSTDPDGGGAMLHLTSTGALSGLFQAGLTGFTYATLDIRVVSGSFTLLSAACSGSCTTGATTVGAAPGWQHIQLFANGGSDELALYAATNDGVDAYLDNLATSPAAPVPEPGEWAMMGLGLAITGALARRRRS